MEGTVSVALDVEGVVYVLRMADVSMVGREIWTGCCGICGIAGNCGIAAAAAAAAGYCSCSVMGISLLTAFSRMSVAGWAGAAACCKAV